MTGPDLLALSPAVLPTVPVRRGDVFAYGGATHRAATVMEIQPGGRALVRIETLREDNQPGVRVASETTRELKAMPRLGRAVHRDGMYLSAASLAYRHRAPG